MRIEKGESYLPLRCVRQVAACCESTGYLAGRQPVKRVRVVRQRLEDVSAFLGACMIYTKIREHRNKKSPLPIYHLGCVMVGV
jgi:hypothetical protein